MNQYTHFQGKNFESKSATKKPKVTSAKAGKKDNGASSASPARMKVVQCVEKADPSPKKLTTSTPQMSSNTDSNVNANPSDDDSTLTELKKSPNDAAKMPAKKSPKKASSTPSSARKRSGKPTYITTVHDAIVAMKERSGSSAKAISNWIVANSQFAKGIHPQVFKTRLLLAIKQGVKENRFAKVKGSYKISSDVSQTNMNVYVESTKPMSI